MAPRVTLPSIRVVFDGRIFLVRFKDGEWYDIKERTPTYVTRRHVLNASKNQLGRKVYKAVVDKAKEQIRDPS